MTRAVASAGGGHGRLATAGAAALALLAAGATWWLYALSVRPLVRSAASVGWTAADCRILSSGVRSSRSGRSSTTSYWAAFSYTFPFAGMEYRGTRYDFGADFSSMDYDLIGRAVEAHPPRSTARCHVSPHAAEAVLHRGPGRAVLLGVAPLYLAALCAGGAVLLAAFGGRWMPLRRSVLGFARRLDPPPVPAAAGAAVEPDQHEKGTLFVLGANLVWNGMLAVLATAFLVGSGPAFFSGDGLIVLLALTPFVLVGIRPLRWLMALGKERPSA